MSRLAIVALAWALLPFSGYGQAVPEPGDVVINEIMYAPSPVSNEYLELYNRSDEPIALDRLEYADANRSFSPVVASDTVLNAGAFAVLVRDSSAFAEAFPSVSFFRPSGWGGLNNGGDIVLLRDGPTKTIIDSVPYDPDWGGSDGSALERIDPAGPSSRAANFGDSQASAGGTPGAQNSIFAPDETPPSLRDATTTASGDTILAHFSEPLDPESVDAAGFMLDAIDAPSIQQATRSDTGNALVYAVLESPLSPGRYTLIASNVSDRRGNRQSTTRTSFRYFETATPSPSDIVITEVLYAPTPAENEFVELLNRSSETFDLSELDVADDNRDFRSISSARTALSPDSHAVVVRSAEAFRDAFPSVPFNAPDQWNALNNGGDTVFLRYGPTGTVVDSVPYRPSWGGADGRSLERIDPAGPSAAASNFAPSQAPAGATPGEQNSRYKPDESAPTVIFAEQVADEQLRVVFSEPLRRETARPDNFRLPSATITDLRVPVDTVVSLSLSEAPSGTTIKVDGVEDRVGNVLSETSVPLAFRPKGGDLLINEVLFDPRTDDYDNRPNQVEYVELLNRSDRRLSLRRLLLSDRPTERGEADTLKVGHRAALPPGGYSVVAAAPTTPTPASESQLARAFPAAPLAADSVSLLPIDARRLGLENDGDRLHLLRVDDRTIADLTYSPGWHAEGLEETKGTALERISPSGPPESSDNWTSSPHPAGGTPGRPNAVALPPSDETDDPGIEVTPSPFSIERDGATRIRYRLEEEISLVRAQIFDARGRPVRTLEKARLTGRTGELVWNGRDDEGNRVRIGIYVVLFEAVRAETGTVRRFKEPVVVARPLN